MILKTPITDNDFELYFYFRWKILRKPYGQVLGTEKDNYENIAYHSMMVSSSNKVLGVGRIHELNQESKYRCAQIRYMAILDNRRKQGIGTKILNDLENHAFNNNINKIILHSRENAIDFYKKNGYKIIEKTHILYDSIQHWMMSKNKEDFK